jgi:outer membrane protein, heavy metal efflux system
MRRQETSSRDPSDLLPVENGRPSQDCIIPFLLTMTLCLVSIPLGLDPGIAHATTPGDGGSTVAADSLDHGLPGSRLTLDDALRLTLERNPEILAARQKLAVSRARLLSAGAFPNPELTMQGEPALTGGDYRLSMGIDQDVPMGGKIGQRKRVAQKEYDRDEAMVQDLERRISGATRRSYRAVLVLTEKLQLAQEIVDLDAHLAEVARARFAKGEVSELDVRQFEVDRSLRLPQMRSLASERTSALLDLCRALGLPLDESPAISDTLEAPAEPLSIQPLLAAALARPGVRSLESERQAAEGQLRLEKAERWGDPIIGVLYSRERSSFAKPIPMANTDNFLGAAIRLPIPLFYRREGEVQEAVARTEAAGGAVDAERSAAEREVRDAYQRTVAAAETCLGYDDGIRAAGDAGHLAEEAYAKGLVGAVQLFQVHGQLLALKAARLDALEVYGRALSDLEEAAGMSAQTVRHSGTDHSGERRRQ